MTKKTCEFYSMPEIMEQTTVKCDNSWFDNMNFLLKNHSGGYETKHVLSDASDVLGSIEFYWATESYHQNQTPPENLQEIKDKLKSLGDALVDV